ncbi:hypothetical protein V5799_021620 [Amblyomma americanum]|uniref:Uncharacterized protein n=1 Tax=Amblyomma americanum TaxID=6943 RepID=A0AAQ4FMT1_AMBAM
MQRLSYEPICPALAFSQYWAWCDPHPSVTPLTKHCSYSVRAGCSPDHRLPQSVCSSVAAERTSASDLSSMYGVVTTVISKPAT